jgi:hypothetical protein
LDEFLVNVSIIHSVRFYLLCQVHNRVLNSHIPAQMDTFFEEWCNKERNLTMTVITSIRYSCQNLKIKH